MSTFEVKIRRVIILPHDNADSLEIAQIDDFQAVVRKGQYVTGDLVIYCPEGSIVPKPILDEIGLDLKGGKVKTMRLRGVLSQGLVLPNRGFEEGTDVMEILGITKYEPEVPVNFRGNVVRVSTENTFSYDIENVKKYRRFVDSLQGKEVVFTEKIHGTCFQAIVLPDGNFYVGSKGLSAQGLVMDPKDLVNEGNVYVRAAKAHDIENRVRSAYPGQSQQITVFGEVFGSNVQDLSYGVKSTESYVGFRVFDVFIGTRSSFRILNDEELDEFCSKTGLTRVPVLYRGPFSREVMMEYTTGKETVSGEGKHIREGIVIRPRIEFLSPGHLPLNGRYQFKSVSADYLTRKGNVTEYS